MLKTIPQGVRCLCYTSHRDESQLSHVPVLMCRYIQKLNKCLPCFHKSIHKTEYKETPEWTMRSRATVMRNISLMRWRVHSHLEDQYKASPPVISQCEFQELRPELSSQATVNSEWFHTGYCWQMPQLQRWLTAEHKQPYHLTLLHAYSYSSISQ